MRNLQPFLNDCSPYKGEALAFFRLPRALNDQSSAELQGPVTGIDCLMCWVATHLSAKDLSADYWALGVLRCGKTL
jgi:hypothetical protein